jgi:hypothetical protein
VTEDRGLRSVTFRLTEVVSASPKVAGACLCSSHFRAPSNIRGRVTGDKVACAAVGRSRSAKAGKALQKIPFLPERFALRRGGPRLFLVQSSSASRITRPNLLPGTLSIGCAFCCGDGNTRVFFSHSRALRLVRNAGLYYIDQRLDSRHAWIIRRSIPQQ